jgi:hypothetical protein
MEVRAANCDKHYKMQPVACLLYTHDSLDFIYWLQRSSDQESKIQISVLLILKMTKLAPLSLPDCRCRASAPAMLVAYTAHIFTEQ